jgi:glycosyltransferase involved in cell wall biosynthesis
VKIALVPSSYAPAIGGIEEVTRQLARQLLARGDDVEVWTHRHPADLPASETVAGVPVHRFAFPLPSARASSVLRWPWAAVRAQLDLDRAVRRFAPDVLHVHGFSGNGVYASAASLTRRSPLVLTLHGETSMDDQRIYDHSVSLRAGLRFGLRRAAIVTAPSRFILDDARRFGRPGGPEQVIVNGVDLDESSAGTSPVAVPFDRFVFAVGRVVHNKGFDLLLRAFAPLAADRPGLGLVIGGDGARRPELEELSRALGIADRLLLPGWLDRSAVASLMGRATVFVLPSRLEPFGVVVLEAMRAGRPVVASSRGAVGEWVVDGAEALLVDPEDVAAMSSGLARVLDDPDLARRLAAAGRDLVEGFRWESVASQYADLYELVTRGRS